MNFFVNFTLPSSKKQVRITEITFKDFKTLNKFLINKNNTHINEYFDNILQTALIEKDLFSEFTNFDKFCALLLLRITSVSPNLEYKDKAFTSKKPLTPFLSKCLDFSTTFSKTITEDRIEIILSLPKTLFFENIYDAYFDSISKLYIDGKEIQINSSNKQSIIDNLPANIISYIKEYSDNIINDFNNLDFDVIPSKSSSSLKLSPYNLSLFEILKALFDIDLKSLIELHYILVNKLHYSADYADNNTLIENLILCNIYEAELQKMKEEQGKIDKPNPLNK